MNRAGSSLMSIAALVIIFAAIRGSQEIVLPLLLAAFIAIIAAAPVAWLRSKGVPASLAIAIIIVAVIFILLGVTLILASSIANFSQALPAYLEGLRVDTGKVAGWLSGIGLSVPRNTLAGILNPGAAMSLANAFLRSLSQLLGNTFLIVVTVIFMLLEASVFSAKIDAIRNDAGRTLARIADFLGQTKHYMAIKAATSLATGVLIGVGMILLGVDYPILWGLLAFLLNFIPNIGSIIAAVPAILLAMLQLGLGSALAVGIYFLAVNMVIGNFIEPRVMGRGMGLSTLVVFMSLVFWGWLLGPVGMMLSVPLTMLVKFGTESHADTRWIAILLSSSSHENIEAAARDED